MVIRLLGRFSYSRKTKFGRGYKGMTLSVRPTVYTIIPDSYFSYGETYKVHTWQKDCIWPTNVSRFSPMAISASPRSLKGKVQYSCSVHIFLMEKQWNFLLHIKIAYDLRVCHDFHSWLIRQFQGNWKEKCNISVRFIFFLWRNIETSYLT